MAKTRIVVIIVIASGDVIVRDMVVVSIRAVAPPITWRRPMTAAVEMPIGPLVAMSLDAVLRSLANVPIVIMPMPFCPRMSTLMLMGIAMTIILVRVMLALPRFVSRSMTVIRE